MKEKSGNVLTHTPTQLNVAESWKTGANAEAAEDTCKQEHLKGKKCRVELF